MREFKKTYKLFKSALDSVTDADYTEVRGWLQLSDELKATALYVAFYPEIAMAWNKIYSMYPWVDECTAVSTLLQYLMKNVSIIKEHPQRFKPQYIYTVAYKCMYSLGHVNDVRRWYQNRASTLEKIRDDEPIDDIMECSDNKPRYIERLIDTRSVEDFVAAKQVWDYVDAMAKRDPVYETVRDILLSGKKPRKMYERKRVKEVIASIKIFISTLV